MKTYVVETEKYVLPLLDVIKEVPAYNNAAWLLRYQIITMLETFKRLLYPHLWQLFLRHDRQ